MNIDTEKLRRAVYEFQFYSRPSSATGSDPATVKDMKLSRGFKTFGIYVCSVCIVRHYF